MHPFSGSRKRAVIIGAGPAGLTAAYELLTRTDVIPLVLEKSGYLGGISRTVNYKGNRIDIGGHRFFSKSDRVMHWWLNILPMQAIEGGSAQITYQRQTTSVPADSAAVDPEQEDRRDAGAQPQIAHLLHAAIFRVPDHAERRHAAKLGL